MTLKSHSSDVYFWLLLPIRWTLHTNCKSFRDISHLSHMSWNNVNRLVSMKVIQKWWYIITLYYTSWFAQKEQQGRKQTIKKQQQTNIIIIWFCVTRSVCRLKLMSYGDVFGVCAPFLISVRFFWSGWWKNLCTESKICEIYVSWADLMCYHSLRGSASTVLTTTGQVNGRWRILTPHRIETHEPTATKFRTIDYVRGRTP